LRQQRDTWFTDEQVALQIDELEHNLRRDDPAQARQFDPRHRALTRNDVAVFALLAAAIVLLAIALATTSAVAWLGGVATYLASFAVHDRHRRKPARPSSPHRRRARGNERRGQSEQARHEHGGRARVDAPRRPLSGG
jgi:hypothetical protein